MLTLRTLAFAAALIAGAGSACAAGTVPDPNMGPATDHQLALRYADNLPQPYAMTYTDEAASSLGVKDGRWEAFDTRSSDPLVPSLKGGVDHGGAMVRLQWHPGE
jgi:hypothetical protein